MALNERATMPYRNAFSLLCLGDRAQDATHGVVGPADLEPTSTQMVNDVGALITAARILCEIWTRGVSRLIF